MHPPLRGRRLPGRRRLRAGGRTAAAATLAALLCTALASIASTADLAGASVVLEPVVTSGLSSPVYATHSRDGSGRLFIVERGGLIKVLPPAGTTPTIFLDIATRVLAGGEQGLLGLAFHPEFSTNRRFFVNYTRRPDGATVIAEYQASPADPNVADPAELVILTVAQPFANHNGGMLADLQLLRLRYAPQFPRGGRDREGAPSPRRPAARGRP